MHWFYFAFGLAVGYVLAHVVGSVVHIVRMRAPEAR